MERAEREIPVFFRNRHLRALLQFFGPHVPVLAMVPAEKQEEARDILEGLLLARRPGAEEPPQAGAA